MTSLNNEFNINYEFDSNNKIYNIYANNIYSLQLNKNSFKFMESCTNFNQSIQDIPFKYDLVENAQWMFFDCFNMTGNPVLLNNAINMYETYYQCWNLTGSPTCGNSVTNMCDCYWSCYNLTGSPVCGDSVTDMQNCYFQCSNLTGPPICGNNVINLYQTYRSCDNIGGGTAYWNSVQSCSSAIRSIRTDIRTNIVVGNVDTYNYIVTDQYLITGQSAYWQTFTDGINNGAYNISKNIYIYNNCEPFDP